MLRYAPRVNKATLNLPLKNLRRRFARCFVWKRRLGHLNPGPGAPTPRYDDDDHCLPYVVRRWYSSGSHRSRMHADEENRDA
jgi:hypothetical protein